jgi:hypothetical protein
MNNYYRFYRAVWVGRVTALPTTDLYQALLGTHYPTKDPDLFGAISDLAYEELCRRGIVNPGAPQRINLSVKGARN